MTTMCLKLPSGPLLGAAAAGTTTVTSASSARPTAIRRPIDARGRWAARSDGVTGHLQACSATRARVLLRAIGARHRSVGLGRSDLNHLRPRRYCAIPGSVHVEPQRTGAVVHRRTGALTFGDADPLTFRLWARAVADGENAAMT